MCQETETIKREYHPNQSITGPTIMCDFSHSIVRTPVCKLAQAIVIQELSTALTVTLTANRWMYKYLTV